MRYEGDRTIPARPEQVWDPITDPATLLACVEGAEEIERRSATEYEGVVRQRVAGVTVALSGGIRIDERDPPERLSFTGVGTDDRTNSRLEADVEVTLEPDGDATNLGYAVDVVFGGRLASLGSRVLARQVKRNLDAFFDALAAQVAGEDGPRAREAGSEPRGGDADGR